MNNNNIINFITFLQEDNIESFLIQYISLKKYHNDNFFYWIGTDGITKKKIEKMRLPNIHLVDIFKAAKQKQIFANYDQKSIYEFAYLKYNYFFDYILLEKKVILLDPHLVFNNNIPDSYFNKKNLAINYISKKNINFDRFSRSRLKEPGIYGKEMEFINLLNKQKYFDKSFIIINNQKRIIKYFGDIFPIINTLNHEFVLNLKNKNYISVLDNNDLNCNIKWSFDTDKIIYNYSEYAKDSNFLRSDNLNNYLLMQKFEYIGIFKYKGLIREKG